MTRDYRDEEVLDVWPPDTWNTHHVPATTKCKHGWGSCVKCGTRASTDVIHSRRTPTKKELRRLRKKP